MCLFMSNVLYSKVKIEIDTNNDELLENIWEHIINIRELKWGTISKCNLSQNFKIYLTITIHFI
jgi:hypothetical protein